MSIVRVGLSETKNFSEGWEAIFGKKTSGKTKKVQASTAKARKKKKPKKK